MKAVEEIVTGEIADKPLLASLLTGDLLIMAGKAGCAKTNVAGKVAQALGRILLVYDASKSMLEDALRYSTSSLSGAVSATLAMTRRNLFLSAFAARSRR